MAHVDLRDAVLAGELQNRRDPVRAFQSADARAFLQRQIEIALQRGLGFGVETGLDLPSLVETSTWLAARLGRPSPSRVVQALGENPSRTTAENAEE